LFLLKVMQIVRATLLMELQQKRGSLMYDVNQPEGCICAALSGTVSLQHTQGVLQKDRTELPKSRQQGFTGSRVLMGRTTTTPDCSLDQHRLKKA